jgi:hypothetical protein
MDEEQRLDILAPLRWLGSGNPMVTWVLLFVLLVVYFWVYPFVRSFLSKRSIERLSARDDLQEQLRVARLKQSDALRAALEARNDVEQRPPSQRPSEQRKGETTRPTTVYFTQPVRKEGRKKFY